MPFMSAAPPTALREWTRADLRYPEQLPVVARHDDIAAAIRDHQVVIVAGETGSGKTTQLPKICLELGRGRHGQIGHTQPRRIAARSVAERIAEELGVELGTAIGYQVRFTDRSDKRTQVKVMTDGILLAELQRDRELRRYDTIIIDEAHERSLNIDFILGYLKQLLPRRPDLKVIVTSATIDPERFAQHFAAPDGSPAPIVEVSGRTHPVEVRYRPLVDPDRPEEEERDQVTGIVEAVEELWTEGAVGGDQDILVFLSGEREIRDAADALTALALPRTEVLPLYARLSSAEQHRVFTRSPGRRIVLATNVAETSLTVPGIRYVVDTGTARISRYSQRTKVQRLPIEPISQASAMQRSGRSGRVSDGIAIRLYTEADFDARPEFTEPQILRTNLASVMLQMTALGLGDVRRFPFVEPPDARQIADGTRLLEEVGAIQGQRGDRLQLSRIGRQLARMPLDPRLGRMLIAADELGCTSEVLVIVAALSIQDPRERPVDKQAQADQQHARFRQEHSDFATLLVLWRYLRDQQKALSGSAFRRMCKAEYLHYLRVREWQDLHSQLRAAAKDARLDPRRRTGDDEVTADVDLVHRALLAGLLSHIGLRDEVRRDYQGARGARFSISPGSTLFRRQPDYVMAAELVETTRVWARTTARIDPEWAEQAGAHLVRRSYSEPRWSRKEGAALATERVTLYGVTLVADRTVQYARINPEDARDLFIRHALVEGDWETQHAFWRSNDQLVRRLGNLEERARRRDLVVDDEVVHAFYDERIPPEVVSTRHFDRWWKEASRKTPKLLHLTEELLTRDDVAAVSATDYPRTWRQGDLELPLTYEFEPGRPGDGVSVHVPLAVLNRVTTTGFDWLVPGLREDLAVALLKSLPKASRRHFVPAPDTARAALSTIERSDRPFTEELAAALRASTGYAVPPGEWDLSRVPDHLRMRFVIEDQRRQVVGAGRDLDALKDELAGAVEDRLAHAGAAIERTGLRTWDLGVLPPTWEGRAGRHTVKGFPALVDRGDSVDVRVLPDEAAARAATRRGVRRLLLLGTAPPWKRVLAVLSNAQKLALAQNPHGSIPALLDDCLAASVDAIVAEHVGVDAVRDPVTFEAALKSVRSHVASRVLQAVTAVEPVLATSAEVTRAVATLSGAAPRPWLPATLADVRAQHASLVRPGFVADTGLARLPDLQRYLRAILARLDRAVTNPREPILQEQIDAVETAYAEAIELLGPGSPEAASDPVRDVGSMIEELRVSLFAQGLGTAYPVSEKRVLTAIRALTAQKSPQVVP